MPPDGVCAALEPAAATPALFKALLALRPKVPTVFAYFADAEAAAAAHAAGAGGRARAAAGAGAEVVPPSPFGLSPQGGAGAFGRPGGAHQQRSDAATA